MRPIIAIAAAAFLTLAFASTEASARPGFRAGGTHTGGFRSGFFRPGFRRFGPGIGLGVGLGYGLGYPYYASYYGYGDGCIRPRRVWTAYGWQIRPVNVCGYRYYGYY